MLFKSEVFLLGGVKIKSTGFFHSLNEKYNINMEIESFLVGWVFSLEGCTET